MTKDAVIDVVHKVICSFFDAVADDSEEPMSEKDKLLLEVNKALCNAIKKMPDEERKKGRWIDVYKDRYQGLHPPVFTCSICKKGYYGNVIGMYYCPVCGAENKRE